MGLFTLLIKSQLRIWSTGLILTVRRLILPIAAAWDKRIEGRCCTVMAVCGFSDWYGCVFTDDSREQCIGYWCWKGRSKWQQRIITNGLSGHTRLHGVTFNRMPQSIPSHWCLLSDFSGKTLDALPPYVLHAPPSSCSWLLSYNIWWRVQLLWLVL